MRLAHAAAIALVLGLAGCGSGDDDQPAPPAATAAPDGDAGVTPPDAGVARGHGTDVSRVAVPERDGSPPEAVIALVLEGDRTAAEATPPPSEEPPPVRLTTPRLRGVTTGRDRDGGVARVRVSIKERLTCRTADGTFERLRTRYFPPPQIERIRSAPGVRLPTERQRTIAVSLGGERCGDAEVAAVDGELWGEAINGSGLEAVTRHIRFRWRAS
jgi:hypothetical protein